MNKMYILSYLILSCICIRSPRRHSSFGTEPEEEPPVPPGRGASRMLRGLMLRRRAVLGTPKCEKSVGRRGSAPDPDGGAYSAPPNPLAGGEGGFAQFAAPSPRTPLTNCHCACPVCMCTRV